jgi:hypothetical protein
VDVDDLELRLEELVKLRLVCVQSRKPGQVIGIAGQIHEGLHALGGLAVMLGAAHLAAADACALCEAQEELRVVVGPALLLVEFSSNIWRVSMSGVFE